MIVNGAPTNTAAYPHRGPGQHQPHGDLRHQQEKQPSADADPGSRGPDQQLRRGIRTGRRRAVQHHHEVGHQPVSRQRLRVLRERGSERGDLPFTGDPATGGKYRPRNRRNDYGGTFGGPVCIPKVYNGHNKTFFFFNYEYSWKARLSVSPTRCPTRRIGAGDFSAISPNGELQPVLAARRSSPGRCHPRIRRAPDLRQYDLRSLTRAGGKRSRHATRFPTI